MTIVCSSTKAEKVLSNKAFARGKGEKKTKLYYGVELEVESLLSRAKEISPNNSYADMQHKLSNMCDEDFDGYAIMKSEGLQYGFEIVTVPATLRAHHEYIWSKFFERTAEFLKASDGTGMHIHFSREGVTDKQLAKALYFVHETSNSGFLSDIAGRRVYAGATWCTQRKKRYTGTDDNANDIIREESSSRGAMTVSCRNSGKTVECRIFRANPTYEGVMQGLEFMDAMLKFCGQCGETEKDLGYKEFLLWFDTENYKIEYPYLWKNLVKLKWLKDKPTTMASIKSLVKVFLKQAA